MTNNSEILIQSKNSIKINQLEVKKMKKTTVLKDGAQTLVIHNVNNLDMPYENMGKIQTAGQINKRAEIMKNAPILSSSPSKVLKETITPQKNNFYFPDLGLDERKSLGMRKPLPLSTNIQKQMQNQAQKRNQSGNLRFTTGAQSINLLITKDADKTTIQPQKKIHHIHNNSSLPIIQKTVPNGQKSKKFINLSPIRKSNQKSEEDSPQANDIEESNPLLTLAFATQKGSSSNSSKVNQDRLVIKKKLSAINNLYLLAVADGHGSNGHLVSQQIKKILVQILEFEDRRYIQYKLKEKQIQNITSVFDLDLHDKNSFEVGVRSLMQKVFYNVNKQIESQRSFDVNLSGSTLVFVIVSPRYIITCNCGDSRAIVLGENGEIILETSDHKPDRPDEKQRIEVQYKGKVRKQQSSDVNDQDIPYRVWSQVVDLPGLAMSRSIGDGMAKGLGVVADPEIQIFQYGSETKISGKKRSESQQKIR